MLEKKHTGGIQWAKVGEWLEMAHPAMIAEEVKGLEMPKPSWGWSWRKKKELKPIIDKPKIFTVLDLKTKMRPSVDDHYGDELYMPADVNALLKCLRKYGVNKIEYDFSWFDCEDISFAAMGVWHLNKELRKQAVFIEWVSFPKNGRTFVHALNSCVTQDEHLLIEPQTAKAFKWPDGWRSVLRVG